MIGSFKVETPSLVLALRQSGRTQAREAEAVRAEPSRATLEPWRPLLSYLEQSGWKFLQEAQWLSVCGLKLAFGALRTAEACVEALLRL